MATAGDSRTKLLKSFVLRMSTAKRKHDLRVGTSKPRW